MNRINFFRAFTRCGIFLFALLLINQELMAKKRFFDYKIDKTILEYYTKPGFEKIVFTYTATTSGLNTSYSFEANVYERGGAKMNPVPIKLEKVGLGKILDNTTSNFREISITLDSATLAANQIDPNGEYVLAAIQTTLNGRLYVSYELESAASLTLAASRTVKLNPSPPF